MFSSTSRYADIENAQLEIKIRNGRNRKFGQIYGGRTQNRRSNNDGEEIITINYKRRRFIPIEQNIQVTSEISVKDGDRLDNLTARFLGNPEQFWQVCDINDNVMHPLDLTAKPGRRIRIGYYIIG